MGSDNLPRAHLDDERRSIAEFYQMSHQRPVILSTCCVCMKEGHVRVKYIHRGNATQPIMAQLRSSPIATPMLNRLMVALEQTTH
jgi:hypothetical protein